jgi:hypothetical protein
MNTDDALHRGRESFARQAWGDAFARLSAADTESALEPADLELLAVAAVMVGEDEAAVDTGARAHQEYLRLGNPARAARAAFWLGMLLLDKGEMARGGEWLVEPGGYLTRRGRTVLSKAMFSCRWPSRLCPTATSRLRTPPSFRRPRSETASATQT